MVLMMFTAETELPSWQVCNDKCYYLSSDVNLTFGSQTTYCRSMSKSRPLVLGFIAEQTLTTELSMCRLVKKDNEPYWINKKDQVLQNSTNTRCRTIQFSGTNLHLDEDVPCWLLSHSICEADRSFCQTSGNNSTVRNGWIKVAKQKPSYKLSSAKYTYCDAKFLCEETWHSKIASAGNESFMELLGISLGITQQMMIGFWTESPGMSCSHGQGEGYVTQYTGPTVHTIEIRKSVNVFKVLCEKDDSTTKATSAMLSSILQTRLQPNTQSGFSPTIYHLTTASNLQTNTQLRQSQLSTEPLKIQKTQSTIVSSTASPTPARSSMQNLATSLLASTDAVWDRIEQEEYFVDYNPMNYNQAETFCREVMNASLVMFLNPLRYFTVLAQIALTNNSFWVGGVAVSSDWHLCLDKCYFLSSKVNISYTDQAAYCQTMGRQSKPVDFGSKLEQSLEAELNTCRLPKIDNEPYWINKKNIQDNKGTPSCRTITFSGNNIHLEQDVSCSALSHPFCETEKSFCQSSGNKNSITHDWVKVAGQSSLYKLSSSTYPYCEAKTFCQKDRHGKIASVGNYSFMGLLATELGISGTMKLDVWLDSPGITCPSRPSRPDKGSVMRYTGPLVHLIESWNAGVDFNVLCETNTTTVAFQTEPRPTLLTKRSTTLKSNRFPTTTTLNMTSVNARNQTTQTTSKMNITSPNTQKPTTPTASELTIMRSVNTQNSSTPATSQTNTQNPITPTNTQSSTTPTMSQTNNQNPTTLTNTQNPTTPAMSQTNNQNPTTPTNTQNPTKTTTTMSQINTPYPTTPTMLQTNSHNPTTPTILKTDTQNQTTPITLQTNKTLPNTHNPNTPTTSHINMTLPNTQNLTTTTTTTTTTTSQTNTNSLNTRNLTTPATSQTNTTSLNTRNPTTPATSQTNTTSQSSVKISTTQKETSVKPKTTAEPSNTQSVTSSTVSSLKTASGQEWTTVGQEEYFINYDPMSYNKAARFCHEMKNASLVKFLDPIRYFTVLAQIALRNSSFWVGAHGLDKASLTTHECLSYIANGMKMTTLPCNHEKFSVCSRVVGGDISRLLEDPGFKNLIRDMTVLKNETGKRIRKQTCAQDNRPSAQAAGGVGVFIICSVIAVLLMSDCSSVRSTFFTRKKKQ